MSAHNRRRFLAGSASAAVLAAREEQFDLEEVTVSQLQSQFASRQLTSEQVTRHYLDRIRSLDAAGPALNSVIETNPDALELARTLDTERQGGKVRGPLHGIPVLLKDNIDTGDRMQTTAGSLALVGRPAARDAFLVGRLRAAGVVVLGKTNLSEWANFRSTRSTSGWSGRGGQTHNPYALDRNPCGSSSGSAVAVSANLATLAVGTETDGSVVCPASMCGLVGIKPTLGLVSRSGIIPIAHSQDTAGPMARTVEDAAMLLAAMAGEDATDPATSASDFAAIFRRALDRNALRGARLGVMRQYFTMGSAVQNLLEGCIRKMAAAGAVIVDPVTMPKFETWRETETAVLSYEFKTDLNRYLVARGGGIKSLADCIAFNRANRRREMPYFEQELMEQSQAKGPLTDHDYKKALSTNHRLTRKDGIDALVKKFQLDALIGPTAGPAWLTDWVGGDHADSGCASPPAVAGYPHVTVPAGLVYGLPVGLSFFGRAGTDARLIGLAYAFEQIEKRRERPRLLATVNYSSL